MYRYPVFVIFVTCILQVQAQWEDQTIALDSSSNSMLLNKEYESLIDLVDSTIKEKGDFYELTMRGALASEKLNKTWKQQYYLLRVLKDSPNDPEALTLLYLNYLMSGQYADALRIHEKIESHAYLESAFPKRPLLHLVNIESGIKKSNNDSLYKPLYYQSIGAGIRLASIPIYQSVSYLKQNSYLGEMNQWQYFITATIPLAHNWNLTPSFHVIQYKIDNNLPVLDSTLLKGTPLLYGINGRKVYKNFHYQLGLYSSNLNYENQFQIQPGITWFPFENNNFSVNITGNYLTEKDVLTGSYTFAFSPHKRLNLSASYLSANARYYSEQNGLLVNNSFDITEDRYLIMTNWRPIDSWEIYAVYLHESKIEKFSNIAYRYNMGIIGLKKLF